ncbi:MAG TPA: hemerythrin domain-containing protein [Leucothrix mucor]|nr:hemerythrin domain-containing protein [Leucothrix mucor]
MDRLEQLKKLTVEHSDALIFADEILSIAASGDNESLLVGIEKIKKYYNDELELHFQHEERTIFAPIFKEHREHIQMATLLLKDHGFIRLLIQRIDLASATQDLSDFATVLRTHTVTEDKELFPLIESIFTDEQFKAVVNFIPLD